MNTVSIILVILIAIASGLLTYFQYFFRQDQGKEKWIPAFFRFLAVFLILCMFLSQKLEIKKKVIVKPKLYLLVDNSSSIKWQNAEQEVAKAVEFFKNDEIINQRFDLEPYSFDRELELMDTLDFSGNQTNLSGALFQMDRLADKENNPLILISDGVQTFGSDYSYMQINPVIYPILVGDTTSYDDLEVYLVNSNKYANLDSEFEVEIFVRYSGNQEVNTVLGISEAGKSLYQENIRLSPNNNASRITAKIKADLGGMKFYKVSLDPLPGEKQVLNNQKGFEIEILDQRSQIALIYQTTHPDLGMLKRSIEKEDKREVVLMRPDEFDGLFENYQAFMLYQPQRGFEEIFEGLAERNMGYFLITGTSTDWNFLNGVQNGFSKKGSYLYEDTYPQFETDFKTFDIEDLGFSGYPPLRSSLGTIEFTIEHHTLLRRVINGVVTDAPLLTVYDEEGARKVALFGENIWKWRMEAFDEQEGSLAFDDFMQSLVQYLYLSRDRETLELQYQNVFYQDEPVIIRAKKYNSDLRADRNAQLKLEINGASTSMYLRNDLYESRIGALSPGSYDFSVVEETSGIKKSGKLEVVAYSAEQRDMRADLKRIQDLAEVNGQQIYEVSGVEKLKKELLESERFIAVEKTESKNLALIDWKLFLVLIILSLSIEWFVRKYRGLN